jgi:iterative type I PKS product template protein
VAARDTSELFTIAREIISSTCRWMRVAHRNRLAMISPNQTGGWCITYMGLEPGRVQTILDEFHAAHNIPTLHKVAIAVVSRSWLTLVGPSSSLRRLAEFSHEIRQAPQVPADAGVPAHAPFMAGVDAEDVLGHSPLLDRPLDWEKVVMVTPSGDCQPRRFGTLRELLCDIFEDILLRILLVDKTIESCVQRLDRSARVSVHEIGNTSHMPRVLETLAAVGLPYDVVPAYQPPPPGSTLTRGTSDLVAIVGMSGRFPGSDNVDEFWHELMSGACHIKKVPESRFDVDRYYDAAQKLKNSTAIKDGAWLNDPGLFDNRFFNVSPREATQMDPVQRLCLTTAHEALEMAGYAPGASPSMDPERVATFVGVTGYDWLETLHQQGNDIYYVTGAAKAFVSGKINYHYKFGRGAYTLDSVCASSTTALTLACKSLLSRDCDMAVAGGGSVFSAPFDFSGVGRSGMISFDGGCRTFHDDADGYARGEGVGMVILKRLEDALADRDNILGVISGSARMYSTTSTSITHPSHVSQEKIYREVLGQTALDPEEIVYVEMHGTGTQAGDFEELTSVLNVMGGQRLANNPLVVGAVKAAMGHGEGVAGVTSLIKTLMMLKHRTIPSQPGVPFQLNHRFPRLDKRNVHIALEHRPLRPSPKSADGRIKMLVNTFDASGGNCSLVIEEPPQTDYSRDTQPQDVRRSHVVALSARSAFSLQRNCENLLGYLERNPGTRLSDLAYTTTARRMHETLRKAFVCNSIEDLSRQLRQQSMDNVKKTKAPRVVFLFTGQGSQYDAMGKAMYQTSKRFREMMDTYQLTALHLGLPEFLPLISGAMDIARASPAQVQLALIALELGIAYMLRSWGIVPDAVIGHSLGEYAALCVAGVLSPSDALYLVGRRALLMEQHLTPDTHAMLATPMAAQDLTARIRKEQATGRLISCAVACINAPGATVASGTVSDVHALHDMLAGEGMRCTLLRVPFGFHSAQVEPVLSEFEKIAAGITFKKPIIPVASTLTGQLVDAEGVFSPSYLARQAREPVNFVGALRAAEAVGSPSGSTTMWVETGPDAVCLGMVRKTLNVDAACLLPALKPNKDSWETAAGVLKTAYENGLPVDWKAYHGEFTECLALLSDLPAYAWDYKNYWTPYTVPPAWEIEQALAAANRGGGALATEQAQVAVSGFIPTMSLHRLVEETLDESAATVTAVFSSDTSAPALKKAVEGHVVSGHALMPLAVFCDMALTSARHCHSRIVGGDSSLESPQMTLRDMTITKAVVLTAAASPIVLTMACYSDAAGSADITFHQANEKGSPGPLVGKCRVVISTAAAPKPPTSEQNQTTFLVRQRMQQLRVLAAAGNAHNLLRPVVYRLFGDYVRCGAEYRSLDEVIVSTGSQDALASLTAPVVSEAAAHCALSPFVYDGVNQLAGFLLNNSIRCEDDQVIYISEGFGESRLWEPLVPGRKYTAYASGQDVDASGTVVDAASYVFDAVGGQLVQMVTGIRFQKMKKAVLDHVLGVAKPAAVGSSRHSVSAPAPATAQAPPPDVLPIAAIPVRAAESRSVVPSSTIETMGTAAVPTSDSDRVQNTSLISGLLAVVAAEVGVSPEDITDETIFGDLGVDSLMAITVLSTLRNELGLDLPPTFFMDYDTVGAAKQALLMQMQDEGLHVEHPSLPSSASSSTGEADSAVGFTPKYPSDQSDSEISRVGEDEEEMKTAWVHVDAPVEPKLDSPHHQPPEEPPLAAATVVDLTEQNPPRTCKIIPLQGTSPSPSKPPIFLLADETGSSANYTQLPPFPGHAVYGVDWPADLDLTRPNLLSSLASAIATSITSHLTTTATGPSSYTSCILGGVSFGAVLAAEVARRAGLGTGTAGLLLLDPAARPEDVLRTRDRLARTRVLRPTQGKMAGSVMMLVPSLSSREAAGEKESEKWEKWREWIPGVEIRRVEGAQTGGFLRGPSVSTAPCFPSVFLLYP